MWKEWEIRKWQRERISRKRREQEVRKTSIEMGNCIQRDLETVGEKRRKCATEDMEIEGIRGCCLRM